MCQDNYSNTISAIKYRNWLSLSKVMITLRSVNKTLYDKEMYDTDAVVIPATQEWKISIGQDRPILSLRKSKKVV